jgi:hypothetical protein
MERDSNPEPALVRLVARMAADPSWRPPQRIHTVWNPGPHPAVSLHAYSPPLTAMTFYTPPGGGQALRPVHAERVGEELR